MYTLLKPVGGVALRWYYRSITITGLERIPPSGPVFLAVNHPNALVDALVVGHVMPRRVRFTAKATIFANPLVARFLSAVGVVPLRRSHDEVRAGAPGDLDPSRNQASFDAVAQALAEGSAVVIFPEGKSHDDPHLAPLRTGLARMVLHATDHHRVRGVPTLTQLVADRLAAVTLNFDSAAGARRRRDPAVPHAGGGAPPRSRAHGRAYAGRCGTGNAGDGL